MKTVKRIVAVLLLTIVIVLVGYLCYTGSRLNDNEEQAKAEVSYYAEKSHKY